MGIMSGSAQDAIMTSPRFWTEGSAKLTLQPTALMDHRHAAVLMVGLMEWSDWFAVRECTVELVLKTRLGFRTIGSMILGKSTSQSS